MINPRDVEKMDKLRVYGELDPEFISEFENGKGDDEENGEVQQ